MFGFRWWGSWSLGAGWKDSIHFAGTGSPPHFQTHQFLRAIRSADYCSELYLYSVAWLCRWLFRDSRLTGWTAVDFDLRGHSAESEYALDIRLQCHSRSPRDCANTGR